jgi:hypothetical protein
MMLALALVVDRPFRNAQAIAVVFDLVKPVGAVRDLGSRVP